MALPPKRDVALQLLERSTLMIHLDPRPAAVVVPPWFKKQPQLLLQVGYNMPVPIRDLEVGDNAVSCTLSFNRSPFFCVLPWSAIYALVGDDGRGMVWPEDVPHEVAQQHAAQARAAEEKKRVEEARSRLRAIPGGGSTPPPAAAPAPAPAAAPRVVMGASCNAPSPPDASGVAASRQPEAAPPAASRPALVPQAPAVEAPGAAPKRKRARKAAPSAPVAGGAAAPEPAAPEPAAPEPAAPEAGAPARRPRRGKKAGPAATPVASEAAGTAPPTPRKRKKATAVEATVAPAPAPTPPAAPAVGGRRQLPPYLRVVK